jgi:Fuc2NAc and GlcNAc transferase
VTTAVIALGIVIGLVPVAVGVAILPGYLAIGWIGWCDDRRGVSATRRLLVHLASVAWLIVVVVGFPDSSSAIGSLRDAAAIGFVWIALAWAVNLFNFMDGTDGIAASQAVFVGLAGVPIALLQGAPVLAMLMGAVAAGSAGFLLWNWQPARIFMGDVGSGSLGFMMAAAPVAVLGVAIEALWPWAILWTTFAVDATVTLLRRALSGERVFDAHRSHAYQILARRWSSHARVAHVYGLINLFWVMPFALAAAIEPQAGPLLAAAAAVPAILAALRIGAGRPDA